MQTMCCAITDASIDARAAFFRHSRRLLDVGLDEFAELLGRIADRLETETRDAFPDFGELQRPGDFAVQPGDDGFGRSRGSEQPVPPEHVESREARFGDRGKLGCESRTIRRVHGKPPDADLSYLRGAGR